MLIEKPGNEIDKHGYPLDYDGPQREAEMDREAMEEVEAKQAAESAACFADDEGLVAELQALIEQQKRFKDAPDTPCIRTTLRYAAKIAVPWEKRRVDAERRADAAEQRERGLRDALQAILAVKGDSWTRRNYEMRAIAEQALLSAAAAPAAGGSDMGPDA